MRILILLLLLLTAGCAGDAVVFAPTPPPPDLSPLRYEHPGGVFSLVVPRTWAVHTINTTVLAAASFARPGENEPALQVAVVNLGSAPAPEAFAELLTRYQTQLRPDVEQYSEQDRQAMGDGSWRMTGLRRLIGGVTVAVNTFIQQAGDRLAVIDVIVPDDADAQAEMQRIVNTLQVDASAALDPADLSALSGAKPADLGLLHVFAWTTPEGVLFITGEVANYGFAPVQNVPVRATLLGEDGLPVAEAIDSVMGYGIPTGGFAPFSLRFGAQPALARDFALSLGGAADSAQAERDLFPADRLGTSDESNFDTLGRFIIRGELENLGDAPARAPRIVATVFDAAQNVIAAAFVDLPLAALEPGARTPYEIAIQELGGDPITYIVSAHALR